MTVVDLRVLGPVELRHAGRRLVLGRRQQRQLLGILILHVGAQVSVDRLIDLLWDDEPPRRARPVIQTRISELRAALAAFPVEPDTVRLDSHGTGYTLHADPDAVDSQRFLTLTRQARDAGRLADAQRLLQTALDLWRGPVLEAEPGGRLWTVLGRPLESARLTAVEDLLTVGLHTDPPGIVDRAVTESLAHPDRDRLLSLALRGLHAAGRTSQALHHYDDWRRWLRRELGIDPSPGLQQLHLALVRGDPQLPPDPDDPYAGLLAAPAAARTVSGPGAAVSTLPADIADFTGRTAEIELLRSALLEAAPERAPVLAVCGPGGVGKTALVLHVAHQVRHAYPDGQLYANLHGVEEQQPASPAEVLARFLRALGVDGAALPASFDERVDLYRSALASRRLLLVLDNVADDNQIASLLPGTPGSAALVTSRRRVGTAVGARVLPLDVLQREQAAALLGVLAGAPRLAAEPEAAAQLCSRCGLLPLAIRIAGAKLAAKPHWSVAKLVTQLSDELDRLDQFSLGALDVRASIGLSYRELSDDARRLLRHLTGFNLPEYPVWLAAAALDTDLDTAETICEELFDAQLINIAGNEQNGQPRYCIHDLVRLYGSERARLEDSPQELAAVDRRAAGALLALCRAAARPSDSGLMLIEAPGGAQEWPLDPVTVDALVADPRRWLERESPTIGTLTRRVARQPETGLSWEIPAALTMMFESYRLYDDWQALLDVTLPAACAAGDRYGEARIRHMLGIIAIDRTDFAEATEQLDAAQRIFQELNHGHGIAVVLVHTGNMLRYRDRLDEAREHYQRSLAVARATGHVHVVGMSLRALGQLELRSGAVEAAERYFAEALSVVEPSGNRLNLAILRSWHARLRLRQGRVDEAEELGRAALAVAVQFGDKPGIAHCLDIFGRCALHRGHRDEARQHFTEALALLRGPRPTILEQFLEQQLAEL
jgi:DNA-binding SARP family transcriptional activator/tetratricopeptide (TPR) repeat protein